MNLVDPDGRASSPVYDTEGNFLGTDDQGLQGQPIVMNRENFTQGMSHSSALSYDVGTSSLDPIGYVNFAATQLLIPERPDYDGVLTVADGVRWAKRHPGAASNPTPWNRAYIDAGKIDFGTVAVGELTEGKPTGVNMLRSSHYVSRLKKNRLYHSVYAMGRIYLELLDGDTGAVRVVNDKAAVYDWNMGSDSYFRDSLVGIDRWAYGLGDEHGFQVRYYGVGYLNKK